MNGRLWTPKPSCCSASAHPGMGGVRQESGFRSKRRSKISPPNCPPTFVLVVLAFSGMCGRKRLIPLVGARGLEPVTSFV
jgi:hypothetical protein